MRAPGLTTDACCAGPTTRADTLMQGVINFAAGESGWFAIDAGQQLWHGRFGAPQRVATEVAAACIGDGADYYVRADGSLWAWGAGFGITPYKLLEGVGAAAAGDTATLAITTDGALWQWDEGGTPRQLRWTR